MTQKHRPEDRPERVGIVSRLAVLPLFAMLLGASAAFAAPADTLPANEHGGFIRPLVKDAGSTGWLIAQEEAEEEAQEDEPAAKPSGEGTADSTPPTAEGQEAAGPEAPLPEIITNLDELPFPARKMRDLILEAANSGDVEKLRPYLGYGDDVTMLSLGGHDDDPIEFLKSLSGDPDGHEILAIMTEILEAPPVKTEQVPGEVVYVWPYFYAYPFDKLTPAQRVEMYRIITHGDYEEMIQFGSYIFYRLGITPEGRWQFFVAGD